MPVVTRPQAARAPGKLVLLGEYAVLEGGPAWVTAIDREVVVRINPTPGQADVHPAGEGEEEPSSPPSILLRAVRHLAPHDGVQGAASEPEAHGLNGAKNAMDRGTVDERTLDWSEGKWMAREPGWTLATEALTEAFGAAAPSITVDSSAFFLAGPTGKLEKAGFGSSAAVVVSILALAARHDTGGVAGQPDRETLFRSARAVHHRAQGNAGSGIDIASSVFGGTIRYTLTEGVPAYAPVPLPQGLQLFACWSGQGASTTELLQKVIEWKVSSPTAYHAVMENMKRDAEGGLTAAKGHDIKGVLESLAAYGRHMSALGSGAGAPIVTAQVGQIRDLVGKRAAVKPSGAGGGDITLVYTSEAQAGEVRDRLIKASIPLLELGYEAPGCSWLTDETESGRE